MQHPTKVFDEWATLGKDKGMEISHAASVSEILDYAISRIKTESSYFSNGASIMKSVPLQICPDIAGKGRGGGEIMRRNLDGIWMGFQKK